MSGKKGGWSLSMESFLHLDQVSDDRFDKQQLDSSETRVGNECKGRQSKAGASRTGLEGVHSRARWRSRRLTGRVGLS